MAIYRIELCGFTDAMRERLNAYGLFHALPGVRKGEPDRARYGNGLQPHQVFGQVAEALAEPGGGTDPRKILGADALGTRPTHLDMSADG